MIISGKKTIELRKWNTRFRGEFLVHAPLRIRRDDCKRLKISEECVTGAIVGMAELYGVKIYGSEKEVSKDTQFHHAGAEFHDRTYGFMLKRPKTFRIPIPWKGRLGFFDVDLPSTRTSSGEIISDIIDEEYRYQWIGRH